MEKWNDGHEVKLYALYWNVDFFKGNYKFIKFSVSLLSRILPSNHLTLSQSPSFHHSIIALKFHFVPGIPIWDKAFSFTPAFNANSHSNVNY